MNYIKTINSPRLCAFLLACTPLLNFYNSPLDFFRLSMFVIFIICIFMNFSKELDFTKPIYYFLLLSLLTIFISLLSFFASQDFNVNITLFRVGMFFFIPWAILCCISAIKMDLFVSYLKFLSILSIAFLFLQVVAHYSFGLNLVGYIPFLTVHGEQKEIIEVTFLGGRIYRPSSFFLEPSHFGLFISYSLLACVFYQKSNIRNNLKLITIFFLSAIVSTSATSVALIGGIALAYLFDKNNGIRISRTLKLIAIVLLIAFTFLAVSDVYVFSRFIESSSRVVGFVDKISNLEPIYAFLGVGIGNQVHYFDNVLHAKYGFVNGFGSLLVQSGLLGLFLFLSFHLYLYFKLSYRGKVTTLVFLAAMFVENVYMGFWMVMFYILMFFEFKTRKNEI